LKGPEKEALEKIQGFIENNEKGWILCREDLQSSWDDGWYDKAGVKRVVRAIESAITEADYEIGVVFDKNGRFIMAKRGGKDSIDAIDMDLANKIFTHNHSGGVAYLDFSLSDVLGACESDMLEMRVVVEGGSFVSLRKGIDGVGSELAEAAFDMMEKMGYTDRRMMRAAVNSRWLKANVEKFGYSFIREVKGA